MLDVRLPETRPLAFDGNFGLERETLRVTESGYMAHTPHPFPAEHPRIVRDFCENQVEINTRVWSTTEEAVAELRALNAEVLRTTMASGECLWPFSNPPPLKGEQDVVPAKFEGVLSGKSTYRDYLSAKYGRYLMTYCGIHVNFSFGDRLLEAGRVALPRDRDALYLHVAAGCVLWGWIVVALTAASPLADSSLNLRGEGEGDDFFSGFASLRCGDLGYWNHFTPVNDFTSVEAYAEKVREYVRRGLIAASSELYYPVRLKPRGANRLETLVEKGVDHIELRCVDLNPLADALVDVHDLDFIHLFFLWCAGRPPAHLTERNHVQAVRNFKNAARYDLDLAQIALPDGTAATVREAGLRVIASMERFFQDFGDKVKETLSLARGKLERPETRAAAKVRARFGGTFAVKGLEWAKRLAKEALNV